MLLEAKSGHSAGPLGMADVFTVLYHTDAIKHDQKNPNGKKETESFFPTDISPGALCGDGARRILPGGRIENFAKIRLKTARASAQADVARLGNLLRTAWLWFVASRRNGLRS